MKTIFALTTALLLGLVAGLEAARSGHKRFLLGRPPGGFIYHPENLDEANAAADLYVNTRWFTQKLDHFNANNTKTFQQRYMVNNEYYKSGGPIFVMIGGEGAISSYFSSQGDWIKNAQKYGAATYQVEHRFYGQTHPLPDVSIASLRYLNSDQALADLAYFITSLKKNNAGQFANAKVIVFGGSYSGAMASWFRERYPNIAVGAVASSGPVHAKADFSEYLETVGKSAEYHAPGCYNAFKNVFADVRNAVKNNPSLVQSTFNFCNGKNLNMTDPMMAQNFYSILISPFMGQVQYNGQGSIKRYCNYLMDSKYGSTAMKRLAYVASSGGRYCISYDYNADVQYLKQNQWSDEAVSGGERQWIWQTCSEFGYYQTTDSTKQPFGSEVPLSFYESVYCTKVFGQTPARIAANVIASNKDFGGLKPSNFTFITMPNGSLDPWHRLSILSSPNPSVHTIVIEGGSHCQDMQPASASDTAAMKAARQKIQQDIFYMLLHG